jgi:hypothetical protein
VSKKTKNGALTAWCAVLASRDRVKTLDSCVCVKLDVCLSVWVDGLRVSGFGDWMTVWGDQGLVALVG